MGKDDIKEACAKAGLKGAEPQRVELYLAKGFSLKDAIALSKRYNPTSKLYKLNNGRWLNTQELADLAGITMYAVRKRLSAGETAQQIVDAQMKSKETQLANKERGKDKNKLKRTYRKIREEKGK